MLSIKGKNIFNNIIKYEINKSINEKTNINYENISNNPFLNLKFIENNINEKWDWIYLSKNPIINYNFIKKYKYKPWCWKFISINENIYWEDIINNLNEKWDWTEISKNCNINLNIIQENIQINWSWKEISKRNDLNINFIKNNLNKNWDWYYLSINICITEEIIENNLNLPWDWYNLGKNKNIKLNFVKKYINKNWCWRVLSYNPNITWDLIKTNNYEWDWKCISINKNITFDIILENINEPWDLNYILVNSTVYNYLCINPEKIYLLKKTAIDNNNYISLKQLFNLKKENLNELWGDILIDNPLINLNLIKKYINKKWYWIKLKENKNIISNILLIYFKIKKIQIWWKKILYNPHNKIGKNFALKKIEFAFEN